MVSVCIYVRHGITFETLELESSLLISRYIYHCSVHGNNVSYFMVHSTLFFLNVFFSASMEYTAIKKAGYYQSCTLHHGPVCKDCNHTPSPPHICPLAPLTLAEALT